MPAPVDASPPVGGFLASDIGILDLPLLVGGHGRRALAAPPHAGRRGAGVEAGGELPAQPDLPHPARPALGPVSGPCLAEAETDAEPVHPPHACATYVRTGDIEDDPPSSPA